MEGPFSEIDAENLVARQTGQPSPFALTGRPITELGRQVHRMRMVGEQGGRRPTQQTEHGHDGNDAESKYPTDQEIARQQRRSEAFLPIEDRGDVESVNEPDGQWTGN